jgi:hypothetical protein
MRCPSCDHDVPDEPFCERCGKSLKVDKIDPMAPKSDPSLGPKPSSPALSVEHSGAAPDVKPADKPDNASSHSRWYGLVWAALAIGVYVVIVDAAVETFVRHSPLRWWIAGAAALYLGLCAATWRLLPGIWRRTDWAIQTAVSLVVLLVLLGATAWMPEGLDRGLSLFGQTTATVLAVVSAVVVALSGVLLARLSFIPLPGKIAVGLLAAYGVAAFLLAVHAGTPFASLFHGGSQWTRLPFWRQGATVGGLLLVPLALLLEIVTGIRRITRDKSAEFAFKLIALCMGLLIVFGAVRMSADDASAATDTATSTPAETPTATSADIRTAAPSGTENRENPGPDEAGYKQASDKLNHFNAAVDVIDGKMDRSLFEIDALAAKLGSDPAVLFHFVRDTIRYEPYVGVLRGALGTLICRAGNSLDRSLLLAMLLQNAGVAVQIANGKLSDQDARTLVQRVFEPSTPTPSAIPASADLTPDLAQALGVDQQKLRQAAAQDSARAAVERGRLLTYTDSQSQFVGNLLSRAGIEADVLTSPGRLISEASDHYWIRYQDGSGKWIDLDPAFASAEPGQAWTTPAETFAPDAIREELYHHLRITLSIRATTGSDSALDQPLIDQDVRIADLQGKAVTVMTQPVPRVDPLKPGITLMDILDAAKVYQTVLVLGDDRRPGKSFDLKGHIGGIATPEGVDVEQAGGIGNASGGLLGGINGALSGDTTKQKDGRIVGEWVDYTLESPGTNGTGPEQHKYHRDIIAPVTVTSWSASNPEKPQVAPTHLADKALRRRLMWRTELLAVSGTPVPDYAGYVALVALKAGRPMLDASARLANQLPVDPAALSGQSAASFGDLLLADGSMQLTDEGSSTAARSYFARPALISYETRITDADKGVLTEGYDIVAFRPRTVANPTASTSDARVQAAKIELHRGILATRLEWSLMPSPAPGEPSISNTTEIFAAAQKQGVPVRVLASGRAGVNDVANLSVPDSIKAELAAELAAGGTVIIPERQVTIDGRLQVGWWRLGTSGELIGIMPGGRGQSMTEQAGMYAVALWGEYECLNHITKDDPDGGDKRRYCAMTALLGGFSGVLFFAKGYGGLAWILLVLSGSYAHYL